MTTGATGSTKNSAKSIRMVPLLLTMVFAVLLTLGGVAGVVVYLAKSNRLAPGLIGGGANAANMAPLPSTAATVVLEPLLVNLADASGHGYLRAGVTLRVLGPPEMSPKADATVKKVDSEVSAPLRDIALDVLGRQQVTDLMLPDGKEKLKVELKKAFLERDPYVKVTDIYFTEFLVQQ